MELGANLASFGSVQSAELSGTEGESVHGSGGSTSWGGVVGTSNLPTARDLSSTAEVPDRASRRRSSFESLLLQNCCMQTSLKAAKEKALRKPRNR